MITQTNNNEEYFYRYDTEIKCLLCKSTTIFNKDTQWVVDYENMTQSDANNFCVLCGDLIVSCTICNTKKQIKNTNEWFIDYYWYTNHKYVKDRDDKSGAFNLCENCKFKDEGDTVVCNRCNKSRVSKEDKWNTNNGHVYHSYLGIYFCYTCNGLIYYNK